MTRRTHRFALGALLGVLALNAFAGGYYALTGALGVPVEWLEGSAFSTYFIPGLVLFVIVGGSAAVAAIAAFAGNRFGFDLAKSVGWILVAWLIAQVIIIGLVSWLQPLTAAIAIAILWLGYRPDRARTPWRTA